MYSLRAWSTLLGLVGLCLQLAQAQDPMRPERTQELWASASVKGLAPWAFKDLLGNSYGRILLNGELGYRSSDNFFAGRQAYADLGARYKVSKWLDVGAEYRYAVRNGKTNRQRLGLRLQMDKKVGRLDLGYRFIFQRNYLGDYVARNILRNRFSVDYNIPKWKLDPELSFEFFTRSDHQGLTYIGTRYRFGTSYSPWSGHTFSPGVLYDRDRNVVDPVYRVIWSIDYRIDLRKA